MAAFSRSENEHDLSSTGDYDVRSLENSLSEQERKIAGIIPPSPLRQKSLSDLQYEESEATDYGGGVMSRWRRKMEQVEQCQQRSISPPVVTKGSRIGGAKRQSNRWLSRLGWVFLILAFIQVCIILGLQISIAVLGDFGSSRLDQYINCVEERLNITLPDNSTYPSFGSDKQIYVYIFVFLILYNFCLCMYAMLAQTIVEVFTFVFINFITIGYSALQVYQFRGFGSFCPPVTTVGWLALVNVGVVLVFNVVFGFLLLQIYAEFGWKVYKLVNCNPALRYYYRVYEIFLSLVKLVIIFTITFLVGQMALILEIDDYEFWMTIPYTLAMICFFFYAFFMVRRESHIAMLTMLGIGILLLSYFCFKIYRYVTRSCPVCIKRVEEIERQREETGQNIDDDRREDFQHLVMIAVLNAIIIIAYLICHIRLWLLFGNGLADHFYIKGHWFDRIAKKAPNETAYFDSVGTGALMRRDSDVLRKHSVQRQSSNLDGADGAYFTPSNEMSEGLNFMMRDLHPHHSVYRTSSLPPIMENARH